MTDVDATLSEQVAEFHAAFGVPAQDIPKLPSGERLKLRVNLILEEAAELVCAAMDRDMVAIADALADLDYVVEGMRKELGIDGEPIAREVHRKNMAKTGGKCRADGKILKPPGWEPPNIGLLLRQQGWKP